MLDQRREVGQHPVDDVIAVTDIGQQPVRRVDRVGDVVALQVGLLDEGVQLAEEGRMSLARPWKML